MHEFRLAWARYGLAACITEQDHLAVGADVALLGDELASVGVDVFTGLHLAHPLAEILRLQLHVAARAWYESALFALAARQRAAHLASAGDDWPHSSLMSPW